MERVYDFGALLDGNIDSISVKLAEFDADQLTELRKLEQAGQKRKGLVEAIDRQSSALQEKADADRAERDAGKAATEQLAKLTEGLSQLGYAEDGGPEDASVVDKALFAIRGIDEDRRRLRAAHENGDDRIAKLIEGLDARGLIAGDAGPDAARDPVDVALAAIDEGAKALLDAQAEHTKATGDLTDQLNKSQAETKAALAKQSGAKPTTVKTAKPVSIDAKAGPFALDDVKNAQILFVGDDDRPFATLPPLSFDRSAFGTSGRRAALQREVDFETIGPRVEVARAYLLSDGKPVAKAELVQPFVVGGGRSAKMPKGTLSFAGNAA